MCEVFTCSQSKMSSIVSQNEQYNPFGGCPPSDNQSWGGLVEVKISLSNLASPTAGGQVFRELVFQFLTALLFGNKPVSIYADAITKMVSALNTGVTVRLSLTGVKRKTGKGERGEGVLNGKNPNAAGRLFDRLPFVFTNTVTGLYDLVVIFKSLPEGFVTYQDYVLSLYETGKLELDAGGVSLGHYMQAFEPLVRFLLRKGREVKLTRVVHSSIMGGVERAPSTLFTMWLYYDLSTMDKLFFSYDMSPDTVSVSLTGGKPPEQAVFKGYKGKCVNLTQSTAKPDLVFEYTMETCARYYIGSGKKFCLKGKPSTGHFALLAKMFPDEIQFVQEEEVYTVSFPKKKD